MQLLDNPSISAGDLNSCFVTLDLTYFLKFLHTAPLLQFDFRHLLQRKQRVQHAGVFCNQIHLDKPLSQFAFFDALSSLSKWKLNDIGRLALCAGV